MVPKKAGKSAKPNPIATTEKSKTEIESDDEPLVSSQGKKTPAKSRSKATSSEQEDSKIDVGKDNAEAVDGIEETVKNEPKKRKSNAGDGDEEKTKKQPKKRKTKEEKETESMPLATRTAVETLKKAMHLGAHVSGAGGVHSSIGNALHIGGNSFALFLKSQRKWSSPPLSDEARDQFKKFCLEHKYDAASHVLPHGSYLVNLAQADAEKAEQAYTCFLDDLQRCEALGIRLYNFHPGNTGPNPRPEAIARIASQLNKAHRATKTVVTVLENMAGSGNTIGSTWEDLRDIIALVEDKSRVGVCIDTCHTFAAGYDLRSPDAFEKTMSEFSKIVGMSYLKALHLNDSKAPFASNRDLHANIGTGFLGLRAFHNVVNFEPFQNLPMVLETPIEKKGSGGKVVEDKGVWATEIKLLEGLIGVDAENETFKIEEQRLQDAGAEERSKFQDQTDKKKQNNIDTMFKKANPKKKKKAAQVSGEELDGSHGKCNH
ncbi:DNA lyase [Calycina marina]|uniref:Apurinic-apyrimidinic endonuclease 1 n=1 Tax=Calycina marina TaxID=1763456 RepID=A0A9P7YYU4_9HELO|nr:DNA lyase [Calycina marina]